MSLQTLRRTLLALAIVAPVTAAHPTQTPTRSGDSAFISSFADVAQIPPAAPVSEGAVDVAAIEHTHPAADDEGELIATGSASYYAAQFQGRRTASGEVFDNADLTAAHRTLPFGSKVRLTNPSNGKSVVVRINDRGPFHKGRLVDVSRAAAQRLGLIARGYGTVELALLD